MDKSNKGANTNANFDTYVHSHVTQMSINGDFHQNCFKIKIDIPSLYLVSQHNCSNMSLSSVIPEAYMLP